jgi:hypothetical protein
MIGQGTKIIKTANDKKQILYSIKPMENPPEYVINKQ